MIRIKMIVSGGQTGTDRAALDLAVRHSVPYSGFIPRGGWAEDQSDPPGVLVRYPYLTEIPDEDPAVRTVMNVESSDVVIAVCPDRSEGTRLAVNRAKELGIPCFTVSGQDEINSLKKEISDDMIINIAGPRESEYPGIYMKTLDILEELFYGTGRKTEKERT